MPVHLTAVRVTLDEEAPADTAPLCGFPMHKYFSAALLALAISSGSVASAAAKSVLIIDTNKPVMGNPVVTARSLVLGGIQAASGNTVTYSGLLLPAFSNFDQIWDIRSSTPITAPLQSEYLSFLQTGGALALIGENFIFADRADTIVDFVALAGGGKVTTTGPGDTQTVLAPFDAPSPVSTITFHSAGGFFKIGHGKGITQTSSGYGGAAFDQGTLDKAQFGKLAVFMDSGLFNPENDQFSGSLGAQSLTRNIVHYLGDEPNPLPGPRGGVPEPGTWGLMLVGFASIGAVVRRRRLNATTLTLVEGPAQHG